MASGFQFVNKISKAFNVLSKTETIKYERQIETGVSVQEAKAIFDVNEADKKKTVTYSNPFDKIVEESQQRQVQRMQEEIDEISQPLLPPQLPILQQQQQLSATQPHTLKKKKIPPPPPPKPSRFKQWQPSHQHSMIPSSLASDKSIEDTSVKKSTSQLEIDNIGYGSTQIEEKYGDLMHTHVSEEHNTVEVQKHHQDLSKKSTDFGSKIDADQADIGLVNKRLFQDNVEVPLEELAEKDEQVNSLRAQLDEKANRNLHETEELQIQLVDTETKSMTQQCDVTQMLVDSPTCQEEVQYNQQETMVRNKDRLGELRTSSVGLSGSGQESSTEVVKTESNPICVHTLMDQSTTEVQKGGKCLSEEIFNSENTEFQHSFKSDRIAEIQQDLPTSQEQLATTHEKGNTFADFQSCPEEKYMRELETLSIYLPNTEDELDIPDSNNAPSSAIFETEINPLFPEEQTTMKLQQNEQHLTGENYYSDSQKQQSCETEHEIGFKSETEHQPFSGELTTKNEEVSSLHAQLSVELTQKEQNMEQMKTELVDIKPKFDLGKLRCYYVREALADFETFHAELVAQHEQLLETKIQYENALKTLSTDLASTEAELHFAKKGQYNATQLLFDFQNSQQELEAQNSQLVETKIQNENELEQLNTELISLEAELNLVQLEHHNVTQLLAGLEASQEEMVSKNAQLVQTNIEMKSELEQVKTDLSNASKELAMVTFENFALKLLNGEIKTFQEELSVKDEEVKSLYAQLAQTKNQNEQLNLELVDKNTALYRLQLKHDELREQATASQENLTLTNEELLSIRAELAETRNQNQEEEEQLRKQLVEKSTELNRLKMELTSTCAELRETRHQNQQEQDQLKTQLAEKKIMLDRLTMVSDDVIRLRTDLLTKQEEVTFLNIQIAETKNQNQLEKEQLRTELANKNIELDGLKQENNGRTEESLTLRAELEETHQLRNEQDRVELINAHLEDLSNERQSDSRDWILERDELFLMKQQIGVGGWGTVELAKFRGTEVAVKKIHHLILSRHNRRLFEREMAIASRCRHPCLVQFIGATNDDGAPLFVMERLEVDLRTLLSRETPENPNCLQIGFDTICALNYLHKSKPVPIIHRDVSSANVLLHRGKDRWRAKLSDYGAANFARLSMTKNPGAVLYCAPEACTNNQTSKLDVYSFGVLFCEMCTQELPIPEERQEQVDMVTNPNYKDLIKRCLVENIESRLDSQDVLMIFERWMN